MVEKVNSNHPDKIADRITGAIVDKKPYQQVVNIADNYIKKWWF